VSKDDWGALFDGMESDGEISQAAPTESKVEQSSDYDNWDSLFDDMESTRERGARKAMQVDPDLYAADRKLSQETGKTMPAIAANRDSIQQDKQLNELNLTVIEGETPVTHGLVRDPDVAPMVIDDLKTLASIEKRFKKYGKARQGTAARHVAAAEKGSVSLGVFGEFVGFKIDEALTAFGSMFLPKPEGFTDEEWEREKSRPRLGKGFGGVQVAAETYVDLPQDEKITGFSRIVDSTNESEGTAKAIAKGTSYLMSNPDTLTVLLAEQALPLVAAAPTGGVAAGTIKPLTAKIANDAARKYALSSTTMAAVQASSVISGMYGAEIAQGLSDGLTPEEAMERAKTKTLTEAAVNAAFAYVPGVGSTVAKATQETIKQGVAGATGAAAGAAAVGEDITLSELMLEATGGMVTAPVDLLIAAHATREEKAARIEREEQQRIIQGGLDQVTLDEIIEPVKVSKLDGRDHEKFQEYMQDIMDTYGGNVELFIDGDAAREALSGVKTDNPTVQALQAQIELGGDVSIPLDAYVTDIAISEYNDSLRKSTR
jgi:hypothetical protein